MPANLPPQYWEAAGKYRSARTPQEKIAALEEMLSIVPKHKGTENLQGELRKKLSKLRREGSGRAAGKGFSFSIRREGAAQVYIIGAANTGKSSLFTALTGVPSDIADYPFTTRDYQVGMMVHEDFRLQLVDTPPILRDFADRWLGSLLKAGDGFLHVLDASSDDLLADFDDVRRHLAAKNVPLDGPKPRRIVVATKTDAPGAAQRLRILQELTGNLPIAGVSVRTGAGLEELKKTIIEALGVIRVYCKPHGRPADLASPVYLARGATVSDFARKLHRALAENLRGARLHRGDRTVLVPREYVIEDRDVLELLTEDRPV